MPKNKPITYPSFDQPSYIIGWGTTKEGGFGSDSLKNAKITVYNNSLCTNVSRSYKKNWTTQICAGDLSGKIDTCQGNFE